jgi:hypothetical protein
MDLTPADRQSLQNLLRGGQQVLESSAATRESEREVLLALVRRAGLILERGETDATT